LDPQAHEKKRENKKGSRSFLASFSAGSFFGRPRASKVWPRPNCTAIGFCQWGGSEKGDRVAPSTNNEPRPLFFSFLLLFFSMGVIHQNPTPGLPGAITSGNFCPARQGAFVISGGLAGTAKKGGQDTTAGDHAFSGVLPKFLAVQVQ
jgi:hypothetical protein